MGLGGRWTDNIVQMGGVLSTGEEQLVSDIETPNLQVYCVVRWCYSLCGGCYVKQGFLEG